MKSFFRSLLMVFIFMMSFVFSNCTISPESSVKNMMKEAERSIPDFFRDSVSAYYPIFDVLTKKEFRNITFTQIPTYKEIEKYLDFDHKKLNCIFTHSRGYVWYLAGDYFKNKSFYYKKWPNFPLYSYIDSTKPDCIYELFNQPDYILIEKNKQRYLVKWSVDQCQPCDIVDIENDLDIFNVFIFPNK